MSKVTVSVLLPAFNAERYIRQSIDSVLGQTFEDLELLVAYDTSSDGTAELLEQVTDPRVRVLHSPTNLGIIGSLNRAMGEARGRYVARLDADDICLPTRFARQVAFLDENPAVLLVGTRMGDFENGRPSPSWRMSEPDPAVLRWLFYISNPIGHPSMMFRADMVSRMGVYLRRECPDAEDFDFSHRVLRQGGVAVIPDTLMLYRLHTQNTTRTRQAQMMARTGRVLAEAYQDLLGRPADAEGHLVALHLVARQPVPDGATLRRLGEALDTLLDAFLDHPPPGATPLDASQRDLCVHYTTQAWWWAVGLALRTGHPRAAATAWSSFSRARLTRSDMPQLGRAALIGMLPGKRTISRQIEKLGRARVDTVVPPAVFNVGGVRFTPLKLCSAEPPTLTVIVDTEAEFDWSKPFDRSLVAVRSVAAQAQAQAIYDGYGLRPIYLVDYAVASQPEGAEPLRRILDRHGCAIGAHLHPWINPPHNEVLNERNSYGGNLPPALEAAKLEKLIDAIQLGMGVRPLFFKAGRYGLGPHTMATLARLGFEVDFSILPTADFRSRGGGADFRFAGIHPARAAQGGMLSMPMTRAQIGLLAPLPPRMHAALHSRWGERLHLPGLLSRLNLVNTITLTPEGVTAAEQIVLLRKLVAQGHRRFVLHYHSPSLVPGNTPYVRDQADLREFLMRIETVCQFFFGELGGYPTHPADLLPPAARGALWPAPARALSNAL